MNLIDLITFINVNFVVVVVGGVKCISLTLNIEEIRQLWAGVCLGLLVFFQKV